MNNEILAAALEAHDVGLCVVPARTDGSKAPIGAWKNYQSERPTVEQLEAWFASDFDGMGIVCGPISGDIEMLEFEGRAIKAKLWPKFREACYAAGVGDVLDLIAKGYSEHTPAGGLHLLYRCEAVEGNTILARRPSTSEELELNPKAKSQVLIETRGTGGYVVVAPSKGTTHPSGLPWVQALGAFRSLHTVTAEQRDALFATARTFDEMPATPGRDVPTIATSSSAPADSDMPGHEFERERTAADVLDAAGFVFMREDAKAFYFRRPGKTDAGHSATVWKDNGTATLYSSAIDAPDEAIDKDRNLSPWQLHVFLNHEGNFTAAAKQWRADHPRERLDAATALTFNGRTIAAPDPMAAPDEAPALEADPMAAVLPEELWSSRPVFEHIRQAARSRMIGPDALLGAVLARVCALTDWRILLPAVVGRTGSLNVCIGLVGPPGAGKGAAMDAADELLPDRSRLAGILAMDHQVREVPAGSGEGMVAAFFTKTTEDEVDARGKTKAVPVLKLTHRSLLVRVDEVAFFSALAVRKGQTTLEIVRQAWSGEALGGTYASEERRARVDSHSYRFALVMAAQPMLARPILEEVAAGTAQRFIWLSTLDPSAPDPEKEGLPAWPGALSWKPASWNLQASRLISHRGEQRAELVVASSIATEIRRRKHLAVSGKGEADPLETHADLSRLKIAGLLAVLDGRLTVDEDDWRIAGLVQDTARSVRLRMTAAIAMAERERLTASDKRFVERTVNVERARLTEAEDRERVAKVIARHVRKHTTADDVTHCELRCIRHAVKSKDRLILAEGLSRASAAGWIDTDDEGRWTCGESAPV